MNPHVQLTLTVLYTVVHYSLLLPITHSYNLNLSLASSWKEPIIGNVLETYKSAVIFYSISPKRKGLLEYIYSVRFESTERRKILVGLCGTW